MGQTKARRYEHLRVLAFIVFCLATSTAVVGCGGGGSYVWVHQLPPAIAERQAQLIAPGDRIFVMVANQPTLTGEHTVGEDGNLPLPLVGRVTVEGSTPEALAKALTEKLRSMLEAPEVSVTVLSRRALVVSVIGEVRQPGSFELRPGARVMDALARAGGLTDFAHRDRVYVVRREPSPLRIRFRFRELAQGEPTSNRFVLMDGDFIEVQ